MIQYPDSISITVSASAYQDSDGMWVPGSSSSYSFECRAEVNSTGKTIAGADGVLTDYLFMIYIPQMTTIIPAGADYVLTSLLNGIVEGKIKRASNGQLNSRLWV